MFVHGALMQACNKVQAVDGFLIDNSVREETVSHRLAVYLEPFFPGFNVDCEYNKSEEEPKKIVTDPDFTCQNLLNGTQQNLVKTKWVKRAHTEHGLRADISVHRRGLSDPEHNMLVVECKVGKPDDIDYSWTLLRLNEFTFSGQVKSQWEPYSSLVVSPFHGLHNTVKQWRCYE